jgi:maleylpyruvate isomerase
VNPDQARLRALVDDATSRLCTTASRLTDDDVRQPSLLPGWTRGHVLTHVARNADGLRNLLIWARTGVETPQYPSAGARDAEIEAGAWRPAADLAADIRGSARAFADEAARLTAQAWQASVHGIRGPAHPAWFTLMRRLVEVEVHHVDLGAGFGPADWPRPFIDAELPQALADIVQAPGAPSCRICVTGSGIAAGGDGTGKVFTIGHEQEGGSQQVSGPSHAILAWLIGRDDGSALEVKPGGHAPKLPAWAPHSSGVRMQRI